MKTARTIRKHEKALRELIENHPDPAVQRIAQGMETALQWARMDVVGWGPVEAEPELLAGFLRKELGLRPSEDGKHE